MVLKNPNSPPHAGAACADLPDLKRLNYFHGQMLGVNDFRTEQAYFRDKFKLHNRCLHGHGTVCGLGVAPLPTAQECKSDADHTRDKLQAELDAARVELDDARNKKEESRAKELQARADAIERQIDRCDPPTPARVVVDCGLALDCEGNELVVGTNETLTGPPASWQTAYVNVRLVEQELEPDAIANEATIIREAAVLEFSEQNFNYKHRHLRGRWLSCGNCHALTIARLRHSAGGWRVDRRYRPPAVK